MAEHVKKREKSRGALRYAVLALLFALVLGIAASAWFYSQRQVAAAAPVDSPMSIYINAAHQEDIQYLDLSGIDMEREDGNGDRYNYQDFVFTVQGEDLRSFKLQLAYTTNNQLTFELYQAYETNAADGLVSFYSVTEDDTIYYNKSGAALPLVYLNTLAGSGNKLADPASQHNVDTYDTGSGKYGSVNQYAEPIYCQTASAVAVQNQSGIRFHNYFILRVIWSGEKMNDRETDMLYIAARAAS